MDRLHKVFLTTALLVFGVVFSYQAHAQTATITASSDADCGNNGCATVTIVSGTPNYDYTWVDATTGTPFPTLTGSSSNTNQKCNFAPGFYYCEVVSAGVTYISDTVEISNTAPQLVTWGSGTVTCAYTCDASINASNTSYSYVWSDDSLMSNVLSTATSLLNACMGTYYVEMDDNAGCIDTFEIVVGGPPAIVVVVDSVYEASCNGVSDGAVDVTVSGGLGSLSYEWQDDLGNVISTATDISGVAAGNYCLIVSDLNCVDTTCVTVTEPAVVSLSLDSLVNVSCYNTSDGEVYVSASGGSLPYTFTFDNTSAADSVLNQACGIYVYEVQDANGCSDTLNINLACPDTLQITLDSLFDISCFGDGNGAIYTTVTGGTVATDYTYFWNAVSAASSDLTALQQGVYNLDVNDDNGCTASMTQSIIEPSLLQLSVLSTLPASCYNTSDGFIDLDVVGGTSPFTFDWQNASGTTVGTSEDLTEGGGIYMVYVTDANGCQESVQGIITEPTQIVVSLDASEDVSCFNAADGEIIISASGGPGTSFQYTWTGPNSYTGVGASITSLSGGTYYATVMDNTGCQVLFNHSVFEPGDLTASVSSFSDVTCVGVTDGELEVSASGGRTPYTFDWLDQNGNIYSGDSLTALAAGTYFLTLTDSNNCVYTGLSQVIDEPLASISASYTVDSTTCHSWNDGSIAANITGGTLPYNILWSNGSTSANANSLTAGIYTLQVLDVNGCQFNDTVEVFQPNVLLANLTQSPENCGQLDGSITASPTGGTPGYSYTWPSNITETSSTLSGLDGGTITYEFVTVTDNNGCTVLDSITVQENILVTRDSISIQDVSCYLGSDGAATVYLSGGTRPYSYQWIDAMSNNIASSNTNDSTIFGVPSGVYTLNVIDAGGCPSSFSVTINESQTQALSATISPGMSMLNLLCFGDNDAEVVLNVTGGTPFAGPHYEYTLNGVQQSQWSSTFSGLTAGAFEIIINDANGCLDTINGTVTQPDELQTTLTTTSVNCFSGNDGAVSATTIGGVPNYTFVWSTGYSETTSGNSEISSLYANTYTVVVTDQNSCQDTASIVVVEPANAIDLTVAYINETCREEDGQAFVVAQGGTPGYTYFWSEDFAGQQVIYTSLGVPNPTSQNSNLVDVVTGEYFVEVVDANGCISNDSITVGQDSSPEIFANTPIHPECFGDLTGEVSVYATSGNPLYEYAVDGSSYGVNQVFTGLSDGIHSFTVRDSLGCIDAIEVEIIQPDAVLADNLVVTNTTCFGDADGTITAFITGGTLSPGVDYSYHWFKPNGGPAYPANPTGLSQTITSLVAGTYTLEVYDENNCFYSTTATVNEPLPVTAVASVTSDYNNADVSCSGNCDASVQVIPGGGNAPYNYLWTSTGTTQDADSNLCVGTYEVVVTDVNGCSTLSPVTVTVNQPTAIDAQILPIDVIHVNCEGWSTGEAEVTVAGGLQSTAGYTFEWFDVMDPTIPLSFLSTVEGLPIGTFRVKVKDMNGCLDSTEVTINDNNKFTLSATNFTTDVSCYGFNDGQASLNPTNGIPPYFHSWSDPLNQQTETAVYLSPGWYTDTIYDAEGCEIIDSIYVGEPDELVITNTVVTEVSCHNAADGQIQITSTGGVPAIDYSLDCVSFQASNTITGLNPGVYTVCVRDANGCVDDEIDVIIAPQPNELVISSLTHVDISCYGEDDGTANITITGGTTNYDVLWSPSGQNSTSVTNLEPGFHNVSVTDANGCNTSEVVKIDEPDPILVDSFVVDNYCAQVNGAYISVYANGGAGTLTYLANGASSPDYEINGLTVGLYTVTIEDDNGCTVDSLINIPDPNIVAFNTDTICLGDSIFMDALANFSDFHSFMWVDVNLISSESSVTVAPQQTTNYYVSAWDNACYSIVPFLDTIPVIVNAPIIDAGEDVGIIRGESIALSVTGIPNYMWSTGEFTQDITVNPLITTYYTAYAVDPSNGCLGMDSVRVFVGMNEGFSPNADGYNDTWEITYLNQYPTAKVEIFNRWGNKLWESSAPSIENWDGTHKGNDLPSGTYYYIISFDDSESREPLSGPVTIVR